MSHTILSAAPSERLKALRFKRGTYRLGEDGELEKRCTKCREYWPADSEFFYAASTGDGLNDCCKACYIENRYPESRGQVGHQFGAHKVECHA
ncbi:MAG: hypothetical protein WC825_02280 [Gallionellaceae bacterium]|jgi:hypothetical protein